MFVEDACGVRGCMRVSAMFCFECERWCCRDHLVQMALVVVPVRWETLICPSCLDEHLHVPRLMSDLRREALWGNQWDADLERRDAFGL